MSVLAEQVIVLTGASSGIGEAAARELAAAGAKLMLGARRVNRLEGLTRELTAAAAAGPTDPRGAVAFRRTDVTVRAEVEALVAAAIDTYGRVDAIVNNAGVMPLSLLRDLRVDEWERTIDVNLRGVLYGIAAVLPHFRQAGRGHVVNVASLAAHQVFATAGVYCATKHAVRAVSDALREEERGRIRVTLISPGAVDTELPQGITDEKLKAAITELYRDALAPADIARAIRFALEQPTTVEVGEIIVRPKRR
jgi:NADP-dependent 3-hydroxy acid dehydrogenase YdfG